jgi:subtilase family serine protease
MIQRYLDTAAADNVTVLASAGDSGYWGQGAPIPAQDPADCRSVLTVGGTSLSVSKSGAYVGESAWGGSGGGYVPSTTEPTYQARTYLSDSFGVLAKPDVAAVADPSTGVWVYNSLYGGWNLVGGTSVACPLWAGVVADVNDERASLGFSPLGTLNAFLYDQLYGANGTRAGYATDFHDVTSGSNGWAAGPGWDAATGLGSFNGAPIIHTLAHAPKA